MTFAAIDVSVSKAESVRYKSGCTYRRKLLLQILLLIINCRFDRMSIDTRRRAGRLRSSAPSSSVTFAILVDLNIGKVVPVHRPDRLACISGRSSRSVCIIVVVGRIGFHGWRWLEHLLIRLSLL